METEALQGPGLICRQPTLGVPVSGQQVSPFDKSFKEGMEGGGERAGAGGQEPSCVARADYACRGADFLDVVFVLERVDPGRCCK